MKGAGEVCDGGCWLAEWRRDVCKGVEDVGGAGMIWRMARFVRLNKWKALLSMMYG